MNRKRHNFGKENVVDNPLPKRQKQGTSVRSYSLTPLYLSERNKSEGPSLQEQDTLGEADMFSKPRDVISNTHVLRDIANFLGSVQKDGQAQTIDHLVDERNLMETAATKEVSKTGKRYERREPFFR